MKKGVIFRIARTLYYSPIAWPIHRMRSFRSASRLRKRLRTASRPIKLNIGAGPVRLDGWINTDIIWQAEFYLDVARKWPVPDDTLDYVYGEHLIEHFPKEKGTIIFSEIARVLRPGGVVRFSTPDLVKLINIYRRENLRWHEILARHCERFYSRQTNITPCEFLNDKMRLFGHHHSIYDLETITAMFERTGFYDVRVCSSGESQHEALQGLERHFEVSWLDEAEQLIVEAVKK